MTEYFTKDGDEFVKVEDNLFTQNDIDTNIIPARLERERKKFADYDTLKEKAGKVDTISTEWQGKLDTATAEKTELEKQLKKAQLETDKVKILHEFKLSDDLSEFVNGDTPEEMRARAEKLSNSTKGGKVIIQPKPKPNEDAKAGESKDLAGKLFNRNSGE